MNPVESIVKSSDFDPISSFFSVNKTNYTSEKVMLELAFLPSLKACQSRPISMLGLIVDHIASLVGQKSLGQCMPVEMEVFIHCDTLPKHLKVIANIELARHGHALFNCQVYNALVDAQNVLATSHGTLKTCQNEVFLVELDGLN